MNVVSQHADLVPVESVPRAIGTGHITTKRVGARTSLDDLRTSGSLKLVFPRATEALTGIMINTSGGLTSGDRLTFNAVAGSDTTLTLSTQAAERGYHAATGAATTATTLRVAPGARLNWLPQELILFDGCNIQRELRAELAEDATFLFVEPVVFGRTAMPETVTHGQFHDKVSISRAGSPLFLDHMRFGPHITNELERNAVLAQGLAMTTLLYIAPDAEARLPRIRAFLPDYGGASLLAPDCLVSRLIAKDSFHLRQALLPILDLLSDNHLPKTWRL